MPNESPSRFAAAIDAIDALHTEDPSSIEVAGERVPAELDYARRMTAWVESLSASPSEALLLAARAQHLCRWRIPRSNYPEGTAGYHRWRIEQREMHAALAAEVLTTAGYDEALTDRVKDVIQKKNLARDPDAQTLEDAACLVFLETQLAGFAEGRRKEQLVDILRKTWKKMSGPARERALALPMTDDVRALVEEALVGRGREKD